MAERVRFDVDGRQLDAKPGDILGRGRHADIAIDQPVVSRKHAQLHRGPRGWFVSDLGSSNGVYDGNGQRVERIDLPSGMTAFTLGPPTVGCRVEVTIPEDMAAPLTVRTPPTDRADNWIPAAHRPVSAPVEAPAHPQPTQSAPAEARAHPPQFPPPPPPPGPSVHRPQAAPSHSSAPSPAQPPTPAPPPPQPFVHPHHGLRRPAPPQGPAGPRAAPATRGVTVRAEGVSVVVDRRLTILQPTSLTLPAGSLTAVVGPSGCGKSTLTNLLSGRGQPTTGVVAIDGAPMTPAIRSRIGVVPQFDAVHEQLTVRRALRAAAMLRLPTGTPSKAVKEAVLETASILDLDERLDTRVAKLSGGQKKRVSVGYELVSTPVMMVLDEPTSGLDPGLEQGLVDELRALADAGTTTVMVTHSPEAAAEADLVVVMAPGGYLTFVGPPDRVLEHFGVDEWADVFGRLTAETGPQWAAHFTQTEFHARHVAGGSRPIDRSRGRGTTKTRRSWFRDFRVMTGRYLRSIASDWRSMFLLAAQAPILGLLFAFVLSEQVFQESLRPRTNAREFILACILAMVWMGASNSVREIVKERRTFLRERAFGVAPSSLVASRWLVLSVITVVQAIVLYFAATSRQEAPLEAGVLLSSGPVELMAAMSIVGLASVGIGLVVSGLVRDANKAMALLPLVLIPIVLFSGLLIPTSGRPGIEAVSWANPIQWGSSASAVVVDVLDNEGCNPTGLEAEIQQTLLGRTISCDNPRWQPTRQTQAVNFGVAGLEVLAMMLLSFAVTSRSTRNLRV